MLPRDLGVAGEVLLLLLLICVRRLQGSALPALSSYEFTAYRMQQFNLAQRTHGEFKALRLNSRVIVSCTFTQALHM